MVVVGHVGNGVARTERRLFGEARNVLVDDRVVEERSFAPPRHDASQMELREVLEDRRGLRTHVVGQVVVRLPRAIGTGAGFERKLCCDTTRVTQTQDATDDSRSPS